MYWKLSDNHSKSAKGCLYAIIVAGASILLKTNQYVYTSEFDSNLRVFFSCALLHGSSIGSMEY